MKGAAYIYVETLSSMLAGFVFWFVLTKIASSEVVGISSTLISLATIFSTLASLGIHVGVQRFLGISYAKKDVANAGVFIKVSIAITSLSTLIFCFVLMASYTWAYHVFHINFVLLLIGIIVIISSTYYALLRGIIIASLKTRMLPIVVVIATIIKFVGLVSFTSYGLGAAGVVLSFALFPVLGTMILGVQIYQSLKKYTNYIRLEKGAAKEVVLASLPTWIPYVIYTIGIHLGPILVFGVHGANEAGVYFIALSITLALWASMSALSSISYPALSAMSDGRKRFSWRVIKMSLIISLPFSSSLIFFSSQVLQIFGPTYSQGATALQILLISMLPIAVTNGISNLAYAYGNYRKVLIIGIASNVPRAALYLLLVPYFYNTGAALSYTIGSIFGLAFSLVIARQLKMKIFPKDLILLFTIPIFISYFLSYLDINYVLSILITLVISYAVLLTLKIFTTEDIKDCLLILPSPITDRAVGVWNVLSRRLKQR